MGRLARRALLLLGHQEVRDWRLGRNALNSKLLYRYHVVWFSNVANHYKNESDGNLYFESGNRIINIQEDKACEECIDLG